MAPSRSSTFQTINGRPLFIEIDGEGPAMIMMHGLGSSSNSLQPLISPFKSSFTIIRFDFEGLGRSKLDPKHTERITIPKYVKDLEAIMELYKIPSAVLVGHSLGSIVAMNFAAQFPEKVKALVLSGPGRSRSHIPAAKAMTLGMAKNARELGMPVIADGNVPRVVAATSSDVVRAFAREVLAGQDAEGYARVCEAMGDDTHVDPDYGKISAPTCIVAGDQDLISPMETSKELQALIGGPGVEVGLKVVQAGHQQVLEATEGVIEAIKSVL